MECYLRKIQLIVKLLLDKGANVNMTSHGASPLQRAINNENQAIIKLLLDAGAEVNTKNRFGKTPLEQAKMSVQPEIVKWIVATNRVVLNEETHEVFLWAIDKAHVEIVASFLQQKDIQVNKKDQFGDTPINHAIDAGNAKTLQLLLSAPGIKVNQQRDTYHDTPLIQAVRRSAPEMVKLLLGNQETQVNKAHPKDGNTLLHMAVAKGNEEIIKLLLDHGAKLTTKNNEG